MKIVGENEDEVFKTDDEEGFFMISMTRESDVSTDGGYSFEVITNRIGLDRSQAGKLLAELQDFLSKPTNQR